MLCISEKLVVLIPGISFLSNLFTYKKGGSHLVNVSQYYSRTVKYDASKKIICFLPFHRFFQYKYVFLHGIARAALGMSVITFYLTAVSSIDKTICNHGRTEIKICPFWQRIPA